ncbi:MAG: HAD family phosphatase [Patescibacteria group bacterium]
MIKAVLFDYDGVLADTMRDNDIAWKNAFAKQGVTLGIMEYLLLEGMTPHAIATKLTKDHGLSESVIADIIEDKKKYYKENNSFRLYPGVQKFITSLHHRGIKLALVSGAASHRIEEMTPKELLVLFDVIITADDEIASKPNPDPYLKALKKIGVSANEAVVVENAPLGIQSARAAAIYCIAVTSTLPEIVLKNADRVVQDFNELSSVIE